MPETPGAMLCTLVDEPFDDRNWVFEPKLGGFRVLARFDGSSLTLMSRNQIDQAFVFPEVVESLKKSSRPLPSSMARLSALMTGESQISSSCNSGFI